MLAAGGLCQKSGVAVQVCAESYDAAVVQELIEEMADDLAQYYGRRSYPPQDPSRWSPPQGTMLVAYLDDVAVACGAVVRHDDMTAEVKRMFTRPRYRRRGIARHLLGALEKTAAELGYRRMVPETGVPQTAAQVLYERAGYARIPCWSPLDLDPSSVCFARELDRG